LRSERLEQTLYAQTRAACITLTSTSTQTLNAQNKKTETAPRATRLHLEKNCAFHANAYHLAAQPLGIIQNNI
jgi:hypothetical protein